MAYILIADDEQNKEKYSKIFEYFYQYKKDYTGNISGLGMVKQMLHLFGGSISVKSRLNEFTRFNLSFPI